MNAKEEEYLITRHPNEWSTIKVESPSKPIYIEEIRISPIDLDISAQLKPPDTGARNFVMVEMILKGLGIVVANIDEAPIRLNGIQLKGCFDSPSGIVQKLIIHYKKNLIMQLYKLFGSFNAIGNPASLFTNIATGLQDLVEKPAEGFVKGPLELGKGLVEGAQSLVAHTVGGAFNSVSKITGTLSSGLSLLAFDKNFEAMRDKQRMKKPKNVIQGLEKGAKAVYSGFKEGMTG
jgi:vacuolar protein sorting-associated protein 13A/C